MVRADDTLPKLVVRGAVGDTNDAAVTPLLTRGAREYNVGLVAAGEVKREPWKLDTRPDVPRTEAD
jgi:hypothetical protein